LSYTEFEYKDLLINREVAAAGESVDISLTVTNTGPVKGDEVVQLYVRDEIASLPRPVKELKGYTRLSLLPGESRSVTFHLPVNQLAFYDLDLKLVLEAGKFSVMIGSSSDDIRLMGEFRLGGAARLAIGERVFFCPVDVE
jgi:beta-glucosidase